ncbi:MAG: HEAT repeat domain-containing protein, partial [Candidatus Omnitrophica bacterium]|nr:HEAT repeat domain-containing protein [Candidatus Omnitrophota bacterium]
MLETRPTQLLESDLSIQDHESKEILVDRLLETYREKKELEQGWKSRQAYKRLSHPQLSEQLVPYITDSSKSPIVRRFSLRVIGACRLSEVSQEVLELGLNPEEDVELREVAVDALAEIGVETQIRQLEPLLTLDGIEGDTSDNLYSAILEALFPKFIDVQTLIGYLKPPSGENIIGSYWSLVNYRAAEKMSDSDLIESLNWIEANEKRIDKSSILREFTDGVFGESWNRLSHPGIFDAFIDAAVVHLDDPHGILGNYNRHRIRSDFQAEKHSERLEVAAAIIERVVEGKHEWESLAFGNGALLYNDDVPWLLERLNAPSDSRIHERYASLIRILVGPDSQHLSQIIGSIRKGNSILLEAMRPKFGPVELESDLADRMRHFERMRDEAQERRRSHREEVPPLEDRIEKNLADFESGDLTAWWKLNLDLLTDEDNSFIQDFKWNLSESNGWRTAIDERTRNRIFSSAQRYIIEGTPHTKDWLCKEKLNRAAYAGYRAFALLRIERPDVLRDIDLEAWRKWSSVVFIPPDPLNAEG